MRLIKPLIKTDRLTIRFVDISDANDFFAFCSKDSVCKYLTFKKYTHIVQARKAIENMIRAYLAETDINFSIVLNETGIVIGSISLTIINSNTAEVGYLLDDNYWNQGIMNEALKEIINLSFNVYHFDCLFASYISENIASEKLLAKNGFVFVQKIPGGFSKNFKNYDLIKTKLEKTYF